MVGHMRMGREAGGGELALYPQSSLLTQTLCEPREATLENTGPISTSAPKALGQFLHM